MRHEIVKLLAACEAVEPAYCITLAAFLGETSTLRAVMQGFGARRDLNIADAINAADGLCRTGIAYASRVGNVEALECLLEHDKANIAKPDSYGNMPLDAAVRNGHYDVIEVLFKHGARLRDTNDLANTSLLGWARLGYEDDSENAIAGLLRRHAFLTDYSLRDDPAPAGYERVRFDARGSWCDVCTLPIATKSVRHVCQMCYKMDIVVCHVCWRHGFRCLNVQNVWVTES